MVARQFDFWERPMMVPVVEGTRGLKRIYRQLEDQSIKNDTDQFFDVLLCTMLLRTVIVILLHLMQVTNSLILHIGTELRK